jgi:hypothetical protein
LLITNYELVKSGEHPKYKQAKEFYEANHTDRRSFLKYYNRYKQSGNFTPSPSGVYNILKRYQKNRLTVADKETKRKMIKERMVQLGHIDCHHLSKTVILGQHKSLLPVVRPGRLFPLGLGRSNGRYHRFNNHVRRPALYAGT